MNIKMNLIGLINKFFAAFMIAVYFSVSSLPLVVLAQQSPYGDPIELKLAKKKAEKTPQQIKGLQIFKKAGKTPTETIIVDLKLADKFIGPSEEKYSLIVNENGELLLTEDRVPGVPIVEKIENGDSCPAQLTPVLTFELTKPKEDTLEVAPEVAAEEPVEPTETLVISLTPTPTTEKPTAEGLLPPVFDGGVGGAPPVALEKVEFKSPLGKFLEKTVNQIVTQVNRFGKLFGLKVPEIPEKVAEKVAAEKEAAGQKDIEAPQKILTIVTVFLEPKEKEAKEIPPAEAPAAVPEAPTVEKEVAKEVAKEEYSLGISYVKSGEESLIINAIKFVVTCKPRCKVIDYLTREVLFEVTGDIVKIILFKDLPTAFMPVIETLTNNFVQALEGLISFGSIPYSSSVGGGGGGGR